MKNILIIIILFLIITWAFLKIFLPDANIAIFKKYYPTDTCKGFSIGSKPHCLGLLTRFYEK